ncbi:MAG: phenylalanine--tRNA ligase subunit beta [Candidatus Micrarchaeota archaeon]|nr:phenylalanine--tRNA ligase subunit beta [Candidatus Micrarchaeota archaeon]
MAVLRANANDLIQLCNNEINEKEIASLLDSIGAPLDGKEDGTLLVEVTPNRPDYLAVEGIAYSLLCFVGKRPKIPEEISQSGLVVEAGKVASRPYIAALVAKDVSMGEAAIEGLMQFQEKIHDTFGRKRKKIAIGMHDLDTVEGKKIRYYAGTGNEKFVPLFESEEMSAKEVLLRTEKGKEFAHIIQREYPIVADEKGVMSFPPILNSERTKVRSGTRNIFVDITGTDRKSVENAACIIAMALSMRGGKIQSVDVKYDKETIRLPNMRRKSQEFSFDAVNSILGAQFSRKDICALLHRTGVDVVDERGRTVAYYPPWRVDIFGNSDIAEDVAIAYGYNNFEPEKPELFTVGKDTQGVRKLLRELMLSLGYSEINTFVLSNEREEYQKLGLDIDTPCVKIANPLTTDNTMLRTSLVPSMLRTIVQNKKYRLPLRLFEIGEVVHADGKTDWHLCAAIYGEEAGLESISGMMKLLLDRFGMEYEAEGFSMPFMIDGRCARVRMKNGSALIGEVHPEILERFGLEYPVAIVEVGIIKGF